MLSNCARWAVCQVICLDPIRNSRQNWGVDGQSVVGLLLQDYGIIFKVISCNWSGGQDIMLCIFHSQTLTGTTKEVFV